MGDSGHTGETEATQGHQIRAGEEKGTWRGDPETEGSPHRVAGRVSARGGMSPSEGPVGTVAATHN